MTDQLFRSECTEPKTLVFAGNGCITDGWKELKEVIQQDFQDYKHLAEIPELLLLKAAESFRDRCQKIMFGYPELNFLGPPKDINVCPRKH